MELWKGMLVPFLCTHADRFPSLIAWPSHEAFVQNSQLSVISIARIDSWRLRICPLIPPLHHEYNDYMSCCASQFKEDVQYGQENICVSPIEGYEGPIRSWKVDFKNVETNGRITVSARIAKPRIPPAFSNGDHDCRIMHSSLYSIAMPGLLTETQVASYSCYCGWPKLCRNLQLIARSIANSAHNS